MTTQCEAYEVMKMTDQPRGARQTTSVATTGPEQAYEEIGEGHTHRIGRGQEARAMPQQEQSTHAQMYEDVSHDTVEKNTSSTHQIKEQNHHTMINLCTTKNNNNKI